MFNHHHIRAFDMSTCMRERVSLPANIATIYWHLRLSRGSLSGWRAV